MTLIDLFAAVGPGLKTSVWQVQMRTKKKERSCRVEIYL